MLFEYSMALYSEGCLSNWVIQGCFLKHLGLGQVGQMAFFRSGIDVFSFEPQLQEPGQSPGFLHSLPHSPRLSFLLFPVSFPELLTWAGWGNILASVLILRDPKMDEYVCVCV